MARSLRILHIYKDYFPVLGGIENHVRVLAEAQAAAGHQVIVSVCSPGPRTEVLEQGGVKIVKSGRITTAASMPISLAQPLAVARLRPDVMHVHSPYPLGEVSAWLLGRGAPVVVTYHSDVVRQKGLLALYAPLLRRFLRRAGRILVTSRNYMDSSPWLAPVRDKCAVVPLGVDERRFAPPSVPFAGPFTLLFAGRLRYYKGLDTLLKAMSGLPGVRLDVCGDGPMRGEWERLAGELGLGERVRFLGEVDDSRSPRHSTARPAPSSCRPTPAPRPLARCCWRPWPRGCPASPRSWAPAPPGWSSTRSAGWWSRPSTRPPWRLPWRSWRPTRGSAGEWAWPDGHVWRPSSPSAAWWTG